MSVQRLKCVLVGRPLVVAFVTVRRHDDQVARQVSIDGAAVLPEFIPARWWQHLLHNQTALLIKGALLFRKGVIVTNVPYHLEQ